MNKSNLFFFPWHQKSRAVKALRTALGGKVIAVNGRSQYVSAEDHVIINYGSSGFFFTPLGRVINTPFAIARAVNKRRFFEYVMGAEKPCRIPEFTTDAKMAMRWATKGEVIGRELLEGHSGAGILFSSDGINPKFLNCKLWVKYIKKQEEYRVHIAFGQVIDVQRKVLRKTDDLGEKIDPKTIDFRIRSFRNGFIFQREGINPDKDVIHQATLAMALSGLDFGAVDVIWNSHDQQAYVLEINTAPGLEGQTVDNYVNAFRKELDL